MPDLSKSLVKLAVKFFEVQAKRAIGDRFIVEVEKELANYAGETALERLDDFFNQGERAENFLAAFQDADECVAKLSDAHAQWIRS
ncbi:MAG: hypothetical protein HZC40_03985 [Chloroflexi bacterium]|nr:hypothetical protein [Chloroflexota bacterium]